MRYTGENHYVNSFFLLLFLSISTCIFFDCDLNSSTNSKYSKLNFHSLFIMSLTVDEENCSDMMRFFFSCYGYRCYFVFQVYFNVSPNIGLKCNSLKILFFFDHHYNHCWRGKNFILFIHVYLYLSILKKIFFR